jgi:two-component system response regulator AtoC
MKSHTHGIAEAVDPEGPAAAHSPAPLRIVHGDREPLHGMAPPVRLLVVGADPAVRTTIERWSASAGARVASMPRYPESDPGSAAESWDLVLVVLGPGVEDQPPPWTRDLAVAGPRPPVVLATPRPSMDLALFARETGALDLLALPPRREDLVRIVERVRATRVNGVTALSPVEGHAVGQTILIGQSPAMLEVYKRIAAVAPGAATVLVEGESGTGKELVARAIHENGPRRTAPFVAVICAAIPESLLESELFGHEKGAFTGAVARRAGRFEQAAGGTLFLDEIADMELPLQAKILRALQEREVELVGGAKAVPVDVRVVAATNADLRAAIGRGAFREDLFHRIAVVTVRVPPLRERGGDIDLLSIHFARIFSARHGKGVRSLSAEALALLRSHPWPGNVRELANAVESAVVVARDETLRLEDLPEEVRRAARAREGPADAGPGTLAEAEARHIAQVLGRTGGRIAPAAEILGIHRNTLARKIRELGL